MEALCRMMEALTGDTRFTEQMGRLLEKQKDRTRTRNWPCATRRPADACTKNSAWRAEQICPPPPYHQIKYTNVSASPIHTSINPNDRLLRMI